MSSDLPAAKCIMAGSWDGPREAFGSQNVLRIVNHKLILAFPSTTARIKSCATAAADLLNLGWGAGMRHSVFQEHW